jgi:hypothetical protein
MDDFKHVKAKSYIDIYNKIKPRLQLMIKQIGEEKLEKKCALTMRKKFRKHNDYSQGFINIAVAFCVDEEESAVAVKKFRDELVNHYVAALEKTQNPMKIQYYEEYTPLFIQFYDPEINSNDGVVPNFYISFNEQGYVLSTENVKLINLECKRR